MEWLKNKLMKWLGINKLYENNLELERRVQSYKATNHHLQSRLDNIQNLVKDCTTVSSDIHFKHNKGSIVFVAGRFRGKDYVKLFNINHDSMEGLVRQLKEMEDYHTRGYYDEPFRCDMKYWIDRS